MNFEQKEQVIKSMTTISTFNCALLAMFPPFNRPMSERDYNTWVVMSQLSQLDNGSYSQFNTLQKIIRKG